MKYVFAYLTVCILAIISVPLIFMLVGLAQIFHMMAP